MANRLELILSHRFDGTIWQTLADQQGNTLFLEVRNETSKKVTFSALQPATGKFILDHISFEEPWWISLSAVCGHILLLTIYTDTQNPDKKSLLAYDVNRQELAWWKNDFSVSGFNMHQVIGTSARIEGTKLALDILTGEAVAPADYTPLQNFSPVRPLQYQQGTAHFDTVKSFLETNFNIVPAFVIEYLEHESLIFISCYTEAQGLANNLYVMNARGEVLLAERIGERLKGIGVDTFFILSGSLIFVKNKSELVSYKLV